jgi:hypothetical protein
VIPPVTEISARWPVRVQRAWARVPAGAVLNAPQSDSAAVDADLPAQMRVALSAMTGAFMTADGLVNYRALAESSAYRDYLRLAARLRVFDLAALATDSARKAFWINLYNSLILHAVIDRSVRPASPRGLFERAAYAVGGLRFSANDIEHGILRANRAHILALGPHWRRDDPRLAFRVTALDPRIHFALNCAARSCPPIRAYTPERLDEQLDLAVRAFLNGGQLILNRQEMRVDLSRLLSWYAPDFGGGWLGLWGRAALLRSAAPFLIDADDRAFIAANAHRLRVRFLPYDWSLNAAPPASAA